MSTVSADTFFGGKVPPPPPAAPAAQAPHPLDGFGVSDAIKQAFTKRVGTASEAINSDQSVFSKILQTGGQAAGFLTDIPTEIAKKVTPAPVKDFVKEGISAVADTPPLQEIEAKYAEFKKAHPEAAANLEASGLIASLLPIGKAGELGVEALGKAAAKGGKLAADGASNIVDAATEAASKAGKAADNVVAAPIPKTVETVLKETPAEKFDSYVEAARKATENIKNPTPLELVGKKAQVALDGIQEKLGAAGSAKSELMKMQGISGFQGKGVKTFREGLQSFLNSKTATEGDQKLVRDIQSEFNKLGATPSKGQVDRFIDFAQDRIYTGSRDLSVPVTTETLGALRRLTEQLNGSLKEQLRPEVRAANDRYSELVGVRNELNDKLGKEGEKGGALMKRVFSPSDANTKTLFESVKKETGIDLTNEAVLARYVMDVMGDTRQKSMLDQLNLLNTKPTPSGITSKIIDYAIEHFNSPDEIIRRARERTLPASSK